MCLNILTLSKCKKQNIVLFFVILIFFAIKFLTILQSQTFKCFTLQKDFKIKNLVHIKNVFFVKKNPILHNLN